MTSPLFALPLRNFFGLLLLLCLFGWSCEESNDIITIEPGNTVLQVLQQQENLSTFAAALESTGLSANLSSQTLNYTLFAPNNEAFTAYLASNGYANLEAIPAAALTDLVGYHLTFGRRSLSQLDSATLIDTFEGRKIFVYTTSADNSVRFNNEATIIESNLRASNGFIHTLDKVLTPPALSLLSYVESRAAAEPAEFTLLQAAIAQAGLSDFFAETQQGFTFFAPTNAAFTAAGYATVEDIQNTAPETLRNILRYHLVPGYRYSFMFSNGSLATQQGKSITLDAAAKTVKGAGNPAAFQILNTEQDVLTSNGIVHAIDGVLLPE